MRALLNPQRRGGCWVSRCFFCLECDRCATACRDSIVWLDLLQRKRVGLLRELRAVKRRAGACRPTQHTARIMQPTARDGQDWRRHRRWQSTVDVWGCAGLGLQSRHKGRLLRVGRMTQHFGKQHVGTQNLRRQRHHGWSPRHVRSDVRLLAKVQVLFGF